MNRLFPLLLTGKDGDDNSGGEIDCAGDEADDIKRYRRIFNAYDTGGKKQPHPDIG